VHVACERAQPLALNSCSAMGVPRGLEGRHSHSNCAEHPENQGAVNGHRQ
jgi:hypothetical protein